MKTTSKLLPKIVLIALAGLFVLTGTLQRPGGYRVCR